MRCSVKHQECRGSECGASKACILRRCTLQVWAFKAHEGLCVCVAALELLPRPALPCPAWWFEAPQSPNMWMQRVLESLYGDICDIFVKHADSDAGPLSLLRTLASAVTPLHELCLLQPARCLTEPTSSRCSSSAGLRRTFLACSFLLPCC